MAKFKVGDRVRRVGGLPRGTHPIRRGLIAAWCVVGAAGAIALAAIAAPLAIVVGALALTWWGVLLCLAPRR